MKRFTCLLLLLCLLLPGCGKRINEPVTFYYVQSEYSETMMTAIASEEREASGHRNDLSYLMALYLMGPSDDELTSPIPRGTRIQTEETSESVITLTLSDASDSLTDSKFSLACACLAMTCFDLSEAAEEVTISSGTRSVTITRDNLTLVDNSATVAAMEETQ